MVCGLTAAPARSEGLACVLCYGLEGKQAQHRQPQPAQRDIPVGKILLQPHTGSEKTARIYHLSWEETRAGSEK